MRIRNREREFATFVDSSWTRLWRTALMLTNDPHGAEDLTQEAMVKTYLAWRRIEDLDRAHGYARVTLTRLVIDRHRRHASTRELLVEDAPERNTTSDHADVVDARTDLAEALSELPPRQRAVVVLRFLEDASVRETAEALGCSEGNVKRLTSEAMAKLRTRLEKPTSPDAADLGDRLPTTSQRTTR